MGVWQNLTQPLQKERVGTRAPFVDVTPGGKMSPARRGSSRGGSRTSAVGGAVDFLDQSTRNTLTGRYVRPLELMTEAYDGVIAATGFNPAQPGYPTTEQVIRAEAAVKQFQEGLERQKKLIAHANTALATDRSSEVAALGPIQELVKGDTTRFKNVASVVPVMLKAELDRAEIAEEVGQQVEEHQLRLQHMFQNRAMVARLVA